TESPETATAQPALPKLNKGWRFYIGMTALALAVFMPLLGFGVPLLGLPAAWAVTAVAVCVAGGPEVLLLVAATLLGKETMHYFLVAAKNWFLRLFSRTNSAESSPEVLSWHCPSGFSLVMEPDRQVMQTVAHGRWC